MREKRKWLHRFCLLTGTAFPGKDGHKYGNHRIFDFIESKMDLTPIQEGKLAGYQRALYGTFPDDIYLLDAKKNMDWHKGYRAGLIEGGKQLEHGPQITDMAGKPMPGYPWV